MNAAYSSNVIIERCFKLTVFILVVFFVAVSVNSLIGAISWIDKPFPGFLLYRNSLVCEVSLSHWTGSKSGIIKPYDRVVDMDGRKLTPQQIYSIVSDKPIGTQVNYTVSRNSEPISLGISTNPPRISLISFTPGNSELINLSIPTMRFGFNDFLSVFGAVYFVGLIIFITGVMVYSFRPELIASKIFFMFCFSMGIWFISIFDAQSTYSLGSIPFISWFFSPAFAISLAFIFPSRKKFLGDNSIMLFPFVPSAILFTLHLFYFDSGYIWDSEYIWKRVDILTWFYVLTSTLAFIASAAISYIKPDFPLEKERAKVILLGAFVGFFIPALCALVITALGISNLNNLAILVMFFPVSIAYAIVKHKLFDIDVIIRGTLVYGTLTGVVVGIFALMVIAFNVAFSNYSGWKHPAFFVILSAFLVIALNPLKNQIQNLIDLTFFRTKYDYHRTIEEISFAMTSLLNLDEITDKIVSTIKQTMFSNSASVILFNENPVDYQLYVKSRDMGSVSALSTKEDSELLQLLNRYKKEIFKEDLIADGRYIRHGDKLMKIFNDFNAVLFIPMFFKEQLIGILSLGEKKSGLLYTSEDVRLLKTLANQSAIAIENALAYRIVEDYVKKLEEANKELRETQMQLIQSEKMSAVGQLAAGIAHEIRNPLNIIEGARYCLSQMIDGENSSSMEEYLDYIKHEVERTNRLIDNLLKFSKVGTPHLELSRTEKVL